MVNVLLLSKYTSKGASSRLRTQQYIPYLASQGVNVTVSSLFDDKYLDNLYNKKTQSKLHLAKLFLSRFFVLFSVYKFDVIWIEKEIFPYIPAIVERLFKLFKIKYVVDYDDAIFHNYDLSGNKLIRLFLSKKIDNVMRFSGVVVVGNDYLAQRAARANANKIVKIPTVVEPERYDVLVSKLNDNNLSIGWIGTPATQKYIVEIKDCLIKVCKGHNASLTLIGAHPSIKSLFTGINISILPWTEESESLNISNFNIGIMPIPDEPFEKGKCGYKLIQYIACSKPVVASNVGVNAEIVEKCDAGYVVNTLDEWEVALSTLLSDSTLRAKHGSRGKASVNKYYSVESQIDNLVNIFKLVSK
ncbi:glycosyltransferase family 4 protein [Pseudoalteromonas sp. SG43-4]|uniref:glycosyltransferase family 4 protein n=1 Tax=Pseudoalteromonas sp. SG43-4 TaxID=2760969 RepID=UPI001602629C|nr:glycosyltransferase family 4 protein [Pseudoalteromonas sp. SG43-4]MBB1429367.1 glycosyltransferase family 4 protein [Pseudoalteromonas sp. SG43-4]